jgi:hypothetical protein
MASLQYTPFLKDGASLDCCIYTLLLVGLGNDIEVASTDGPHWLGAWKMNPSDRFLDRFGMVDARLFV